MWPDRFDPRKGARRAVDAARRATGEKLRGATLYGSVTTGEFHPTHSDVNIAFVFSKLGTPELVALHGAHREWQRARVVQPLLVLWRRALRSRVGLGRLRREPLADSPSHPHAVRSDGWAVHLRA